jgi:hypothetical protein
MNKLDGQDVDNMGRVGSRGTQKKLLHLDEGRFGWRFVLWLQFDQERSLHSGLIYFSSLHPSNPFSDTLSVILRSVHRWFS